MLSLKALALCVIAAALYVTANVARAESYGSDAPKAGVAEAKAKTKDKVRFVPQQYVVHPQISTQKRGK